MFLKFSYYKLDPGGYKFRMLDGIPMATTKSHRTYTKGNREGLSTLDYRSSTRERTGTREVRDSKAVGRAQRDEREPDGRPSLPTSTGKANAGSSWIHRQGTAGWTTARGPATCRLREARPRWRHSRVAVKGGKGDSCTRPPGGWSVSRTPDKQTRSQSKVPRDKEGRCTLVSPRCGQRT